MRALWQHLVASHEAMDALHWAMRIALYCPGSMVIEIAIDLATYFNISDSTIFNYSFIFRI